MLCTPSVVVVAGQQPTIKTGWPVARALCCAMRAVEGGTRVSVVARTTIGMASHAIIDVEDFDGAVGT